MKIAVCRDCEEIMAVGPFTGNPTDRVKARIHVSKFKERLAK